VQEQELAVNGCRVRLRRFGQGPALLYLPEGSGAGEDPGFLERLGARFSVILPDHPGFGGQPAPDWLRSVGDLAFFYLDMIDVLGVSRLHLAGASLGGWIAAEMAIRRHPRLASLSLIAPLGIALKGEPVADLFVWTPEEFVRNQVHDQALAETLLARPADEAREDAYLHDMAGLARLCWNPRFHNPSLATWLHRIEIPTLLLWGVQDSRVPPAYGEAFRQVIPGARLETFENCGHWPQIEVPDALVARLAAFAGETP
jgi:pimeloyl-ACP methyl ester carboxylesterase